MPSQTFTSSGTWAAPPDLTGTPTVEGWGEGGNGGAGLNGTHGGGGAGGGEFAQDSVACTPGVTTLVITIGTGGTSTPTTVTGGGTVVTAHAGGSGVGNGAGAGGTGSSNATHHDGGSGGTGSAGSGNRGGGGGGSSAGTGAGGGNGGNGAANTSGTAGTAPAGGGAGGAGGNGSPAVAGTAPGGGGGGGSSVGSAAGAGGAAGQVTITWTVADGPTGVAGATAVISSSTTRSGSFKGYAGGLFGFPRVVNQWTGSLSQPVTPPAIPDLQSVVVQLTPANLAPGTGGTGIPTQGTWLFALIGWQQEASAPRVTFGVGDDIHSWWRPGVVSTSAGITRTAIWYTPNTARTAGYVYVPPNGSAGGVSVNVVEVAGLGPWDTVTGVNSNYAANVTSLSLSLGAPGADAFLIAAGCGDNTTAGQAFAPAGWTTLATVSTSNGTDHTGDAVLTSAFLNDTTSSASVSVTASSPADLSGAILGVRVNGTSPIPANQNPDWPHTVLEAGLGSGFQTPLELVSWTDLTTRLWGWDETTGIQYQLGAVQSADVTLMLDNYDGALNPGGSLALTTGTPVRLRMALGIIGGVTVNRQYVIHRNFHSIPQRITAEDLRRHVTATATDGWSALSSTTLTPYRNEVYNDSPYAWWPCNDAPLSGGVLPKTLLNAALGNPNVLTIAVSPNGATLQDLYSTTGTDLGSGFSSSPPGAPDTLAVYSAGASAGWMYGDPQSALASLPTGNPQSPIPGSAAVQFTGQAGNTGSYGWWMYCNDPNFPHLSSGVTIEGWFQYPFLGSAAGVLTTSSTNYDVAQQPYCALTLWEIASSVSPVAGPVAVLQMDVSGHLNLITYSGATPTSNAIWTTSDLRDSTWFHVAVTMTQTTWAVYVNGGLTAAVTGTAAGMTNGWQWLIVNGDLAANGGSAAGTGLVHGGNAQFSHLAVYGYQLPAWRIMMHYWVAITGGGLLPAPQSVQVSPVTYTQLPSISPTQPQNASYTPDGTAGGAHNSTGYGQSGSSVVSYGFSAVAVAFAGAYNSGPSAWSAISGIGSYEIVGGLNIVQGQAVSVTWAGLAQKFGLYTAAQVGTETQAVQLLSVSETFTAGYGNTATVTGPGKIAAGSGASPPASASAIGDTVAQRIERLLQSGQYTVPLRAIDPAPNLVQAPGSAGAGQQTGQSVQAIAQSDGGMLFIDNPGYLTYWQKPHLAGQYSVPVWMIGPSPGRIPYYRVAEFISDPQRIWNVITIQPFAPDGANLPLITPASATLAQASITQNGAQPLQITSWLQSTSSQQNQANFLLANFGVLQVRGDQIKIDAAPYPAAWVLVAGVNVGDVVSAEQWQVGGGGTVYTLRVTQLHRSIKFGANGEPIEAVVELTCDFEPSSYWA